MKASITALDDGTVTISIETEGALELALMRVFYSQTYAASTPARVSKYGPCNATFTAVGRPLEKEADTRPNCNCGDIGPHRDGDIGCVLGKAGR